MHPMGVTFAATVAFSVLAALAGPGRADVTAYQGVRLIVGAGSAPIETATLLVDGKKIVQAGQGGVQRLRHQSGEHVVRVGAQRPLHGAPGQRSVPGEPGG